MRLVEFGDLDWVPRWYDVYLREFLFFYYKLYGYYKLWIPALKDFFHKVPSKVYLECCSGSGEVLPLIIDHYLKEEPQRNGSLPPKFLLSDLKPDPGFIQKIQELGKDQFQYIESPLDATNIPPKWDHPLIFINSFHHLDQEIAEKMILKGSVRGLIVLEYVNPSILGFFSVFLGSLSIFFLLPFVVKPRDLPLMILFTYFIPVFPLMVLWDGIVSCLHVYTKKDFEKIFKKNKLKAQLVSYRKKSLLYPAGVTAVYIVPIQYQKVS